jgi:hypothetical protein
MRAAKFTAVVGLVILGTVPASAQEPSWHFQWKNGQMLKYRVDHNTTVTETVMGVKEQTTSKLKLVKQWKVLAVDGSGVGTLQLTLLSMRNEQIRPNGETLIFDSAEPDKSTPALKDGLMKYVGTPIAEVRIDAQGRVLESKKGPIERYDAEPALLLVLPAGTVTQGKSWERPFTITLNPPQGTGEKYSAVQQYECKETNSQFARIGVRTVVKNMPANPLDQVPLFQRMPEGEVIFNYKSGYLHSAHIRIVRDLTEHQGKNSSYRFESDYREEFVPAATGK